MSLHIVLIGAAVLVCSVALASGASVYAGGITVLSPKECEVVQRESRELGQVLVSGRVDGEFDTLQAKVSGPSLGGAIRGSWRKLPFDKVTGGFATVVPVAAGGWYKLELRATKAGKEMASAVVWKFGVGEVFVTAGQSNSTNCGQETTKQTSGMVSSFFDTKWQVVNDPLPGAHDGSTGGSPWLAFGDTMYKKYGVPIGIAVTGYGGSSVNSWPPGSDFFSYMVERMRELGVRGFRAVLWHQGESDAVMPTGEYVTKMTDLIRGSNKAAGFEFPWFVAQASYHNAAAPVHPLVVAAQHKLWATKVAVEGPNTDVLTGDNRDYAGAGIHFSPKGLKAHGEMWAEKVGKYLDAVLGR